MDRLRRARRPFRAQITRVSDGVDRELEKEVPDKEELRLALVKLNDVEQTISELDRQVLDMLLDAEATDEEQDEEYLAIEEYKDRIHRAKRKIELVVTPERSPSPSTCTSVSDREQKRRCYKLPTIEIKKFSGELKEWLGFWSQFEKIHNDEDLHVTDKFQYLVQSMMKGSRASQLVDSYPQSGENYEKVITALKNRFGDPVLLSEVYVRELLRFVNKNTGKTKSIDSLAFMYDQLESHLRCLESLGVAASQSAIFLYPMIESSLPEDVIKVWQRSPMSGYNDGDGAQTAEERLKKLMKFLECEVKGAERLEYVKNGLSDTTSSKKPPHKKPQNVATAAGLHAGDISNCVFCEKPHSSVKCWKAKTMSVEERQKKVRDKKCCFQCMKPGHWVRSCKGNPCPRCGGQHAFLLCLGQSLSKEHSDKKPSQLESPQHVSSNLASSSKVTLMTLMVTVIGANGNRRKIRALIDGGSHRTYISERLASELELSAFGQELLQHNVFGGTCTEAKKYQKFMVRVQNEKSSGFTELEALAEGKICGEIARLPFGPWMNELKRRGIWISDVGDSSPEIELLIGADNLPLIMTDLVVRLDNGLRAEKTKFGWTLIGKLNVPCKFQSVAMQVTSMLITDATVEQLWKLETIGISDPSESRSKAEREEFAKKSFLETVARNPDGRYSVRLPWIDGVQKIPSNRLVAEKRLQSMTRKLEAQGMYQRVDEVFKEWLDEGIIEEVHENAIPEYVHYLPHRAVVKTGSSTTPVRPVFDASCKVGRNPSLNECLEKGPNLLELIPSLVTRFREGKIGVISDIRKAFPMVEIQEVDRDFLRFLWWKDLQQGVLKTFRHRRVVFGLNCGPFLLGATIEHHIKSSGTHCEETASKILKSLYVDNVVTSVSTSEEYCKFKSEATALMAEAKMDLRMWQCNSVKESEINSPASRECGLDSADEAMTEVLGLKWDLATDTICVSVGDIVAKDKITKRAILSSAQKIFDPMGFLCPFLLFPKKLLQETWSTKLDWDEEVSPEMKIRFESWFDGITHLEKIKIPRCMTGGGLDRKFWQIHTFVDASQVAYAAATFLRVDAGDGDVSIQLIQAKSRVAPIKKTTIPRLELLACTIGARLTASVKSDLNIESSVPIFMWSDSTTALAWIKRNDEWGTFVGNRVREICSLTEEGSWRHVPGVLNPADLPSRGCTAQDLVHSRWWEGPAWLTQPRDTWPSESPAADEEAVNAERRKTAVCLVVSGESTLPWYGLKSSFVQNVKIMAWTRRFIDNTRKKRSCRTVGQLTIAELDAAERIIMKLVQNSSWKKDDHALSGIKTTVDNEGIIRVKSRLFYGDGDLGVKYPIVLPHEHPIVDLLIQEEHRSNGHAGAQFLMAKLREKFWILKSRKAIRRVIGKCVICRRFTSKKTQVAEAPLPVHRVKTGKVFEVTGVDLAGPLFVKGGKKCWIVLFTCAVYRSIHLELVKTIGTEDFLDAFSRFCNRRGRPSIVYSDNGTNFVGAYNLFKNIDWKKVQKMCELKRIIWKFNPPAAPWWGGWWERLIRSVKDVLKRTLGKAQVTYEKLSTLVCDAEAFVNGRPLTTVTEDLDDLTPLTPAMFLQEIPQSAYSDLDFIKQCDFQDELQKRKNTLDQFKTRFRREYLAQLVMRGNEKPSKQFQIGDVVIISMDNKKRMEWPIAKIVELYPGPDGFTRVAKVRTATGFLVRPVQRLYSLEVSSPKEIPKVEESDDADEDKEEPSTVDDGGAKQVVVRTTRSGREVKPPCKLGFN